MSDINIIAWYQSIHCVFFESLCDDCVTNHVNNMHGKMYIGKDEH